ncbi:MAG: hypothetical protein Terrestrivirus5_11 [Terrestrivirus sp.]|uniref:NadR/Ttd14 AAA domain-containing protein n=1 Tax=Terrestrivirus sp. TaxID=2487775 RepID=A0A3G4ZRZ3_9VIRU|nr:MAG: hypothetical protein Terrestrivirus5_11 [Terrestrivirus sp.]
MEKQTKTFIINLIAGPGCGKTTMCAQLFVKLKLLGFVVEYVQEHAKNLVWKKDFETLNNQYMVTKTQYDLLKQIDGKVEFVVTDAFIGHGLYYNLYNKGNTSNVDKTEKFILKCYSEFNNINIFLERGNFGFEQAGRIQTEDESREIDVILKHLLKANNIPFKCFKSDIHNTNGIITEILIQANKQKKLNNQDDEQVYGPFSISNRALVTQKKLLKKYNDATQDNV